MDYEKIKEVILEQREDLQKKFAKENIIDRECRVVAEKFIEQPNILTILGVRRCGKSILSYLLFGEIKFGYINFDDERLFDIKTEDLNKILQNFYEIYGEDLGCIILDEIQNVNAWELFANRLRRTKRVIITGSNSKLLSGELATHLTGRHIDFTLFPFSFREFLIYNNLEVKEIYPTRDRARIIGHIREYMSVGGFPERYIYGEEIVRIIYNDIITKDVVFRHKIKMPEELKRVANYLISNFSREFTYTSLKRVSKARNLLTISNWVSYLSEAYLIFILERFSFRLKEQIIAPKKVYPIDTGIINSVALRFSEDLGRLMENLVAIELLRRKSYWHPNLEVYYWKDHQQREVDFVLKEGLKVKQLIQVCYNIEDFNTRDRELKALVKASKELNCNNLLAITWDYSGEEEFNGRRIKFIPLWKWLLTVHPFSRSLCNNILTLPKSKFFTPESIQS